MSDFNQCYDYDTALKRMYELDDIGLYWFEEPINYRDFNDCAKLSSRIKTPISIGENFHGTYDLINSIKANASTYIMPDLMRIGGISGWLKSASIAEAYNLKFSTHLFPEVSAHLMNLTPTAHWLEWVDWANPILQDTGFRVENGKYYIPNIPGTGVEWNNTNIEKYKVNI
jgi:mandelate racemase